MNEATKPADAIDDRLRAAREAKEAREKTREKAAEALELQLLELEAKYEPELGPMGKAFFILTTTMGPVVIKRGDSVVYKRFEALQKADKATTEKSLLDLIVPCLVYPDKDTFIGMVDELKGLPVRLATRLVDLYQGKEVEDAGK